MTATATIARINKDVGGFVRQHVEQPARDRDELAELIRVVDSIDAVPSHLLKSERDKSGAVKRAVVHYLSQSLARHYPIVSSELLNRQRWIRCEARRGRGWSITGETLEEPAETTVNEKTDAGAIFAVYTPIPLLIVNEHRHGSTFGVSAVGYGSHRIVAKCPEVPAAAEVHRRSAMAVVFEMLAKALRVDRIGHVVESLVGDSFSDRIEAPQCRVAWVPLLAELQLERTPPDPALLLDFHGYMHLVTHWDAPGERPIEAILREYTSGKMPPAADSR